jgi:hypothetical protein
MSPDGVTELLLESEFEVDAIWPGEGWHAFKAISALFRGPFRIVHYLSWIPAALYQLQCWLLTPARRIMGKVAVRPIIADGIIAGAVFWIARRPGAQI